MWTARSWLVITLIYELKYILAICVLLSSGHERNDVMAVSLLQPFLNDPSLWRDCGRLKCRHPYASANAWARHRRRMDLPPQAPLLFRTPFYDAESAAE